MHTPTPTPRTDAEANNASLCDQCVPADFARQLETDLAAETKAVLEATRAMRLIQDELTETRAELERVNAILDWMADERIVDGIHNLDIDEMTSDALVARDPDYDGNEEAWKLEWRKQFRIAIQAGMPPTQPHER